MVNRVNTLFILLGAIGSFIILIGVARQPHLVYYIVGAFALLATAIYFRLFYFVALQLILIAGHFAIVFGSGPYTQFALPILLSSQFLLFYCIYEKKDTLLLALGVSGISMLSMGFAYDNQWALLFGSLFVAIYSYHSVYKGHSAAYIWAVLNTTLVFLAAYRLLL